MLEYPSWMRMFSDLSPATISHVARSCNFSVLYTKWVMLHSFSIARHCPLWNIACSCSLLCQKAAQTGWRWQEVKQHTRRQMQKWQDLASALQWQQSFLFLLLPASAHSITRGSRNLGFFSAAIFTRQIKGVWQGSARADTYAHSLPRNHICAAISPRHQQPDWVPVAVLQLKNPEQQRSGGMRAGTGSPCHPANHRAFGSLHPMGHRVGSSGADVPSGTQCPDSSC